ncbi:MAG: alpha/beta fold hydrolase [Actinomycetota bacterium]|nr:alpha/beta fold hydrolase [Actinomycetota bacterium]
MSFSGHTNGAEPGADVPLVITLNGGTYTSQYFDIPGYSLLDRAAALDIPLIALDRPNYVGSSPLTSDESIILANADVLGDAIGSIWREHGSGTAGVVLIGHSIGAAVATAVAAAPQSWPLLGLAISGCLMRVPAQSRAAWEALPEIDMIDLPVPMKDQVMFGPPWTYAPGMPAASHPSNTSVPKAELLDITGGWLEHRAEVCGRVAVPVHHRQGEFDALWVTNTEELDQFRAGFTSSPSVDSRLQAGSGHCIDFHRPCAAFQLSQLSFALQCALPTEG